MWVLWTLKVSNQKQRCKQCPHRGCVGCVLQLTQENVVFSGAVKFAGGTFEVQPTSSMPWKHRLNPPFSEFRFLISLCRLCTSLHGLPNRDLNKSSLTVRSQSNFCLCFFGQKENLFCYVLGFRGSRYGLWRAVTLHPPSLLNLRRSLVGLTAQAGWDPTPDAACPLCTRTAPKFKSRICAAKTVLAFYRKGGFYYCHIWIIGFLIQRCSAYALFFLCMTLPP